MLKVYLRKYPYIWDHTSTLYGFPLSQGSFYGYIEKEDGVGIYPAIIPMMDRSNEKILWYCKNKKKMTWIPIKLKSTTEDDWEIYCEWIDGCVDEKILFDEFLTRFNISAHDYIRINNEKRNLLKLSYDRYTKKMAIVSKIIKPRDEWFRERRGDVLILMGHFDPETYLSYGYTCGEKVERNCLVSGKLNEITGEINHHDRHYSEKGCDF